MFDWINPLFAFNDLRWDRKTEPLRYEESRREYRSRWNSFHVEAVNRFFNVLQAQVSLQIAQFNLANNDTIYKIEQGRYNIGTTSQDKLLQVEVAVAHDQGRMWRRQTSISKPQDFNWDLILAQHVKRTFSCVCLKLFLNFL